MTIEQANREYTALLRGITLDRELGRGSYATTYAATDTDGSSCRIKIIRLPGSEADLAALREDGLDDGEIRARLESAMRGIVAQIDRLRRLDVPSIMAIEDRRLVEGRSGELILLVRCEPLTIFDDFAPAHDITANDILNLGLATCAALEAAGEVGVLHGNLKPSNLFVAPDGTVCVADFAEERLLGQALDSVSFDSLQYMAPELQEDAAMSAGTDLYALGIVLYSLFNNRCIPFLGRADADELAIRRAILQRSEDDVLPPPANADENVATMLNRACALDPKRRYPSAAAFADDLRDCLLDEKDDYVVLPATETIYEILPLRSGEPAEPAGMPMTAPAAPMPGEDEENDAVAFIPPAPAPTPARPSAGAYAAGSYAGGYAGGYAANSAAIRAAQSQPMAAPTPPPSPAPDPVAPDAPDEDDYYTDEPEEGEGTKHLLLVLAAILALLLLFGGIVWGINALTGIGGDDAKPGSSETSGTVDRTTADAPETNAPITTDAVTTDNTTTTSPTTTDEPATTTAPSTTAAPATTAAPTTTAAPVTTAAPTPKMPALTGKTYDEATAALTGLGVAYSKTEAYSDSVAAGQIISQSIAAGASVPAGTTVSLTVSLGREQTTVPSLVGQTQTAAEQALAERNLAAAITTRYDDTAAAGLVLAQSTAANAKVDVGTTVTLTVSLGQRAITLPNFVGMTRAEAEKFVTDNEMTHVSWQSAASTAEKDTVYAQSIAAGTAVGPRAELTLYISLGGSLTVPSLTGMDETTAAAILRGQGYAPVIVYQTANTTGVLSTSPAAGTALAAGETVTLTVTTRDSAASKLSLPMGDLHLGFAETVTLQISGAQGRALSYRSSDSKVATVDGDGKVTANAVGQALITVTAGSESAQCYVNVSASNSDFTTTVSGSGCIITAYRGDDANVVVPDRINGLTVTAIADSAFAGKAITSIRLPATVTSIGASAFEGCPHLTTVSLPASLRSIGARAFASCGVLRSVDIPASVTSIGEAAFERCYALEAAYLPAGLTQIGARAFRYCSALTLYVPSGSPAHDYAKANGLTVKTIG